MLKCKLELMSAIGIIISPEYRNLCIPRNEWENVFMGQNLFFLVKNCNIVTEYYESGCISDVHHLQF